MEILFITSHATPNTHTWVESTKDNRQVYMVLNFNPLLAVSCNHCRQVLLQIKSKCFAFFLVHLVVDLMNSLKGSCFYIWFQDWIMIAVLKSVPKIGCYQIVWGGVNKTEDSSPPTLLTRIMIRTQLWNIGWEYKHLTDN